MNYRDYNDQELLDYISENDDAEDILYKKYNPLIQSLAKKMHPYCKNSGIELSDLVQEGMLGFSRAIKLYKKDLDTSFYTYAKKSIERRMISAIISSKRLKHKILNDSVSLDLSDEEGNSLSLENLFFDGANNPESLLMTQEQSKLLLEKVKKVLTDFECQVFELKCNDFEYKEIAQILDKSPKAIDNALQRIKGKIKKLVTIEK